MHRYATLAENTSCIGSMARAEIANTGTPTTADGATSHAGKPERIFIRSPEDSLVFAVVNALDTLDNGISIQGAVGICQGANLTTCFPASTLVRSSSRTVRMLTPSCSAACSAVSVPCACLLFGS